MFNKKGFTLVELVVVIVIMLILAAVVLSFIASNSRASACFFCTGPQDPSATELQKAEQDKVTANQTKMETAVPIPQLSNSLERTNIRKRLETFNDPNKVSYIYLVNYGRVMSFYTIKGKVTSGTKRLTSTQRKIGINCGQYCDEVLSESPELDGTYGSSGSYIFFWTTEGVYVQWSGDYLLVDQPLQLTTQPELVREVK